MYTVRKVIKKVVGIIPFVGLILVVIGVLIFAVPVFGGFLMELIRESMKLSILDRVGAWCLGVGLAILLPSILVMVHNCDFDA